MKSIIQCNSCNKEIEYAPGPNGNYRQLCNDCKLIEDEKELDIFQSQMALKKNKYLSKKDSFDFSDMFLYSVLPTEEILKNPFFIISAAQFINSVGINGTESATISFLNSLSLDMCVLFFINLDDQKQRLLLNKNIDLKKEIKNILEIS